MTTETHYCSHPRTLSSLRAMSIFTLTISKLLALLATAMVFFASFQFGRQHVPQINCVSSNSKVEASQGHSIASVRRRSGPLAAVSKPVPETLVAEVPCVPQTPQPIIESANVEKKQCSRPLDVEDTYSLHLGKATVPEDVFSYLHHPASPAKHSVFYAQHASSWTEERIADMPCNEVYLTRTGSRGNQPNKCVAVVSVSADKASQTQQSHRMGYTALNTNQYQQDYPRSYRGPGNSEPYLLGTLLQALPRLKQQVRALLGDKAHAVVMVANAGVVDLLLNFVCSAEAARIDLGAVLVFVGDMEMQRVVQAMGIKAIYDPALGAMPTQAAGSYLDHTFSRMMWFKAATVYLTLMSGYDVLFQDVDLVWLLDPLKYFENDNAHDVFFMDDGARTPRYTPFFVNSGFYYVRHNERTVYLFEKLMKAAASEIGQTHSHQSVLIRHIAESVHLFSVKIFVLNMLQFPSGQAYHENKPYIRKIQARSFRPFVFHMCWTDNRANKLVYFRDVKLWLLPETSPAECASPSSLLLYATSAEAVSLRDRCCQRERYWPPPSDADFEAAMQLTSKTKTAGKGKSKGAPKAAPHQLRQKQEHRKDESSEGETQLDSAAVETEKEEEEQLGGAIPGYGETADFVDDDASEYDDEDDDADDDADDDDGYDDDDLDAEDGQEEGEEDVPSAGEFVYGIRSPETFEEGGEEQEGEEVEVVQEIAHRGDERGGEEEEEYQRR